MKSEIILTNSSEKAIVDEGDFDVLAVRNWFLDGKHPYTNVMVPIDDPRSRHKSYPLKVRMDRYLYRLTTHNFVRIRHWENDPLNNCRSEMFKDALPKIKDARGMTRWLGVKSINGYIVAEYHNKSGILLRDEFYKLSRTADHATRLNTEQRAAEQYDLSPKNRTNS